MKNAKHKKAKAHKSEILNNFFTVSDKDEYEKTEKHMLLAMRIENGMKAKGLSKTEFATAMGVQPSVITKWLSGTHNFTTDTLYDIEKKLSIILVNTQEATHVETISRVHVTVSVVGHYQAHNCNYFPANLIWGNEKNLRIKN